MRTREEIEDNESEPTSSNEMERLILEVLLDIRDLLEIHLPKER